MKSERPLVLSIAGFDPSGGAGLLADCKAFEVIGVQGMSICTAITFQNESEFEGVRWINREEIQFQLSVLFRKYTFEYVKIGLIESVLVLEQLVGFLKKENSNVKIIWDPILKASAGFSFHDKLKEEQLKKIANQLYLITPNTNEMIQLLESGNTALDKALAYSEHCMVLLTGGHSLASMAEDVLVIKKQKQAFVGDKIENGEKHGSGCVLSASLVAYLALGYTVEEACRKAKQYTAAYLASSKGLLGSHMN